jgi:hypothetical protein
MKFLMVRRKGDESPYFSRQKAAKNGERIVRKIVNLLSRALFFPLFFSRHPVKNISSLFSLSSRHDGTPCFDELAHRFLYHHSLGTTRFPFSFSSWLPLVANPLLYFPIQNVIALGLTAMLCRTSLPWTALKAPGTMSPWATTQSAPPTRRNVFDSLFFNTFTVMFK